ncbi:MAG: type II CRISPR RNA-guided endonuclease Cas9, partial [Lentimicrobiaceae bacterium]|nr:type II CRISPR RNA-guided endonuclease Cas9 [Lentimicrobiaceae bacterium]
GFSSETINRIKNIKFEEKDYGSYSEKAIKKLLPLMRMGKYWNADAIDAKTKERIDKIITGEYDEKIKDRVREKTINLTDISQFKGLPLWLACYVVYDRHSEAKEITKWESPDDIDTYLKNFKQHSLRNPIVEQIVTETLRTVRDIWRRYGNIDEIHVELGREMKNPADKRKRMTAQIQENENTNLRIKAILQELINPEYEVENVRPYSPMQQEILKIYEEYAIDNLDKNDKDFNFVSKISKNAQPSKSDIIRYKAWLEQKYRSPYTGKTIPLGKLFTSAYQIEHIIPQSRYFDDSFSNKVICEAEVNQLKDRQLGYEFIKNHHGERLQLTGGEVVEIFSVEAYEDFVKKHYNGTKKTKLLMEDIPDKFIERQMNDSRYISKYIKGLLSNIVREKDENGDYEQEAVSKNLISCNGTITDRLKKDWGIDNVWNRIILPRFERLNDITGKDCFTAYNTEGHLIPNMPLELQKGFNKKRIDHRHHAMDAIVIACTTRDHVNLLNNEAAHSKHNANRYQLSIKLRKIEKVIVNGKEKNVFKEFYKPWDSFAQDAFYVIDSMIVSFKQNLRVINKTVNKYEHFDENGKKVLVKQEKGDSWAIRKSLHKDTVFGEVNLRKVKETKLSSVMDNPVVVVDKELKAKISELKEEGKNNKEILKYFDENKDVWTEIKSGKVQVYYFTKETKDRFFATRKPLDTSFDKKKIENEVTDTGIQKILIAHLKAKDDNSELAFSPDGIDEMNRNIVALNNGKPHQPILKVRVYEKADKFAIGNVGGKSKKFVEAAKGTNLFFAVYTIEKLDKKTGDVEKIRTYATIPLNIVIDCQKQYQKEWKVALDKVLKEKEFVDDNSELQFIISPNDLVYVPTSEELRNEIDVALIDKGRIYKFVDSSGVQANFVPNNIAKAIFSFTKDDQSKMLGYYKYNIQNEIGVGSRPSKSQNAISGEMIKEICIPIKVDRLGEIIEFNGNKV